MYGLRWDVRRGRRGGEARAEAVVLVCRSFAPTVALELGKVTRLELLRRRTGKVRFLADTVVQFSKRLVSQGRARFGK